MTNHVNWLLEETREPRVKTTKVMREVFSSGETAGEIRKILILTG